MFRIRATTATRRGHLAALGASVLGVGSLVAAATPSPAGAAAALGAVQYNYSVAFTAGQTSATKIVTPVTPAGKVFVIQTISIYRYPASASTLQTFLGLGGGYIALADITGNSDNYPAATTTLTAYVTAGQTAYVNLYRTGAPLPAETAYVTLTGYLTAN